MHTVPPLMSRKPHEATVHTTCATKKATRISDIDQMPAAGKDGMQTMHENFFQPQADYVLRLADQSEFDNKSALDGRIGISAMLSEYIL